MRTLLTLTLVALALPAAAAAGGWATAGVSPPPAGIGPGDTWQAELTLLQHGVTPLEGVHPTITISGPETRTFEATPTGEPGVYVAEVVFPSAGSWRYAVDDDFSQVHTFAPVQVGAPVAAPSGGDFPAWAVVPIVAGALALAALGMALVRRRTPGVPALR
ncbi:MAG: FixH family protein [Gaiellaceae bacterium]